MCAVRSWSQRGRVKINCSSLAVQQPGYLSFLLVPKLPWVGSLMLGLSAFNPSKSRAVFFHVLWAVASWWRGGDRKVTTVPKGQVWEEWGWAAGSQGVGAGLLWVPEHCDGPRAVQEDQDWGSWLKETNWKIEVGEEDSWLYYSRGAER